MQINGKPRHVLQWHISHACNLRCRHCYQEDYQHSMPASQLYEILDKYTRYIRKNNFFGQINLTGGEPLLHPEFFPLAREIRRRGIRLGILTNGTLIDDQCADRILALHPVFVQISLDGARRQHDLIRGKGAFHRSLKAVRLLKKRGIRVLVSFTAQKDNLHCFPELARICHRYRVDKLWWDRVVTDNHSDQATLTLTTDEFQQFITLTRKLEEKYRRVDGSSMISNQRSLQFLGYTSTQAGYVCSAGQNLLAVLADGTVMPCRRLPLPIGNIHEQDFQSLLDSSEWIRTLSEHSYPESCIGCVHLPRCMGGARCVTYGQTGRLSEKDPNCYFDQHASSGASVLVSSFPE